MVTQLLPTLKYLDEMGIMHRNLTPQHILVGNEQGRLWTKLTNFISSSYTKDGT